MRKKYHHTVTGCDNRDSRGNKLNYFAKVLVTESVCQ